MIVLELANAPTPPGKCPKFLSEMPRPCIGEHIRQVGPCAPIGLL